MIAGPLTLVMGLGLFAWLIGSSMLAGCLKQMHVITRGHAWLIQALVAVCLLCAGGTLPILFLDTHTAWFFFSDELYDFYTFTQTYAIRPILTLAATALLAAQLTVTHSAVLRLIKACHWPQPLHHHTLATSLICTLLLALPAAYALIDMGLIGGLWRKGLDDWEKALGPPAFYALGLFLVIHSILWRRLHRATRQLLLQRNTPH